MSPPLALSPSQPPQRSPRAASSPSPPPFGVVVASGTAASTPLPPLQKLVIGNSVDDSGSGGGGGSGDSPSPPNDANNQHQNAAPPHRHKFAPGGKLRTLWSRVRSSSSRRGSVDTSASSPPLGSSPNESGGYGASRDHDELDEHTKRVSSGECISENADNTSNESDAEAIADVRAMLRAAKLDERFASASLPLESATAFAANNSNTLHPHTPHRNGNAAPPSSAAAASAAAAAGTLAMSPGGRKKRPSICAESGCGIESVPEDQPLCTSTSVNTPTSGVATSAAANLAATTTSKTMNAAAAAANGDLFAHTIDSPSASPAGAIQSGIFRPRRMTFTGMVRSFLSSRKFWFALAKCA